MNIKNMTQFMEEFENRIFPIIQGEDGQGIERLRTIVEKKRIEVAERQIRKNQYLNSLKK